MLSKSVDLQTLVNAGRWRAELHVHGEIGFTSEKFNLVKIGDIAEISKRAVQPEEYEQSKFYYIGLEHVQPVTGNLLNVSKVTCDTIKSRSKIFSKGDVLYGRLRPSLRKAVYINTCVESGLCSPEFIVFQINLSELNPVFFRELLVSQPVTTQLKRLQGGAALPRVSPKDIQEITIPLPSINEQNTIAKKLLKIQQQRDQLEKKLEQLNDKSQSLISAIFD